MRDLTIRQDTAALLRLAQTAASAAIGLRGNEAKKAIRGAQRREDAKRWEGVVRLAHRTRFDAVKESDRAMVDTSTTSPGPAQTAVDA